MIYIFFPLQMHFQVMLRFGHQGATYSEARGSMKIGGNVKVDTKAWVAKAANKFEWTEPYMACYW